VNALESVSEPLGLVTVTSTDPAACGGVWQVIVFAFTTTTATAAVPPKSTVVSAVEVK